MTRVGNLGAIAAAFWSISPMVLDAQMAPTSSDSSGYFQVRYVSNLTAGESFINVTNNGASSTAANLDGGQQNGSLCVNAYSFSPDEQLISCCSCLVTPNGLVSFAVSRDLTSNPLTPIVPDSVVVKLLSSTPDVGGTCNPASVGKTDTNLLTDGLLAWGTTLHRLVVGPGGTFLGVAETRFANGRLSRTELQRMTSLCGFIRANGSGYGLCKNCRFGGLGAEAK